MGEAALRALEPKPDGDDLGFALGLEGERGLIEILEQDGLDAVDVDEVEGQGPAAGEVETKPAVFIAHAKELLSLADLGPGHGSGEKVSGELPDVSAMTLGLADHPDAAIGDEVTLWGEELPVEQVARLAGTIPYELLCGVTQRVDVRYVT